MMSLDLISEKKNKYTLIMNEANKQFDIAVKLQTEIIQDRIQYAKEQKFFSKVIWKITDPLYLVAESNTHEELDYLFQTEDHCHTEIDEDTQLNYFDDELSLSFNSIPKLISFCKENDCKIDISYFESEISKLKEKIAENISDLTEIEQFVEKFKNRT